MDRVIAAILAGGEGRRFRPYTEIIPKPMIPVGPEEKPILEHIVVWLVRHGLQDIVVLAGYRWRQIWNYFRDGRYWGARIRYSIDTPEYNGTGGALLNAYRQGLFKGAEHVLVWYGDILAPLDVRELLKKHLSTNADATLALADRYQVPVGVAKLSGDNVVELVEKPWLNINVTIGVLVLRKIVLSEAERNLGRRFDIMSHLIPWMIKTRKRVKAYIYRGHWYDVGSMERYAKLNHSNLAEFLILRESKE